MMNKLRFLLSWLWIAALATQGGELTFNGTTDKAAALYQPGETMVFRVQLLDDSKLAAGKTLKWRRTGDDAKTETGEAVSSATEPLAISTALDKPGFVRIEVWVLDAKGKPLLAAKNQPVRFDGGAGVEVEKLQQGIPEPADFDDFWTKQRARLAEVPLKFTMVEVPSKDPAYVTCDVKIDCAGGKPVSGYFTKPKGAAPKSLKAHATFMGYGIASARPYYSPGMMMLNINAHGIENGKPNDFYKDLGAGELKKYAFRNEENAKPETAYFNGMILRVLRALEFLKAQPEWDGRNLISSGGSQGGFQALAAAALDKDVSKCLALVPWCCDLGGVTLGRLRGWRPDWAEGLGYYDPVNMAKRSQCETTIVAGLGDYVCPPSGVCVLYNNLKAPKRLELIQGRTHSYNPPNDPQKITLNCIVRDGS
ncbi:MAG: acetylxylan esterase [Lentisphaeria bacterium]|jgi:cephalosporin-C deacetylase-like acetyl esterase